MANLAIKGHPTRGNEVIEILEMLGGKNTEQYEGFDFEEYYIIEEGYITQAYDWNNCMTFTLEEFLEKYPYKVGDKVSVYEYETKVRIDDMKWDGFEIQYSVFTDETEWYSAEELNKYNDAFYDMKTKSKNSCADCIFAVLDDKPHCGLRGFTDKFNIKDCSAENNVLPNGYELQEDGYFSWVQKKPKYPTTYEECCNVLGCDKNLVLGTMPMKYKVLINLQKLLICRDTYWKIAGEKLGLDRPWEPTPDKFQTIHVIRYVKSNDKEGWDKSKIDNTNYRYILSFPTEEMRDAFYENFKELIESVKELL